MLFIFLLEQLLFTFILKISDMKNVVLAFIITLTSSIASAQADTTKIEQYCTVVATPRLLSSRVTIDIDYGERRSIWKDNRVKDEEGRAKKFNSIIDALNFMGNNGWSLVNAFPVTTGNNTFVYHYVFRKFFLKSEAVDMDN